MRPRLLRLLFTIEFLLALQVIFTVWVQVGGQYHLELMFWPWKFGLSILAASLIVAISAGRRVRMAAALLVLTIAAAGFITYYYHLNEPADQDQDYPDQQTSLTRAESAAALPHPTQT